MSSNHNRPKNNRAILVISVPLLTCLHIYHSTVGRLPLARTVRLLPSLDLQCTRRRFRPSHDVAWRSAMAHHGHCNLVLVLAMVLSDSQLGEQCTGRRREFRIARVLLTRCRYCRGRVFLGLREGDEPRLWSTAGRERILCRTRRSYGRSQVMLGTQAGPAICFREQLDIPRG